MKGRRDIEDEERRNGREGKGVRELILETKLMVYTLFQQVLRLL